MSSELILASASAARARLLRGMGIPFRVVVSGIDEAEIGGETPEARAERLARAKAEAVAARQKSGIILGADSLVVLLPASNPPEETGNPTILGKPRDPAEAAAMLRLQMDRESEVITAVCLIDAATGRRAEGIERSRVRLNPMSDEEIERYAAAPRVLTSAGGYLIEDEKDPYVSLIAGELGTVLGLPITLTRRLLGEFDPSAPTPGTSHPP